MKQFLYSALGAALAFIALTGCKNKLVEPPKESLYQTIQQPDYSLFVLALSRSGYSDLLSSSPSLTVFAPDNAAFAKEGLTEDSIKTMETARLAWIIGYHLIGETVTPSRISARGRLETRSGYYLYTSNNNGIYVNNVQVPENYTAAANGIILPINTLLIPPQNTLYTTIAADTTFSIFTAAILRDSVRRTLLKDSFNTGNLFTVFAPTNNAFRRAGISSVAAMQDSTLRADSVSRIVRQHYVANVSLFYNDFISGTTVKTANDSTLVLISTTDIRFGKFAPAIRAVTRPDTTLYKLVTRDRIARNGILHSVDTLMMPKR